MNYRIASIDVGKVNFGLYVQDTNVEKLEELERKYKTLPKKKQRRCLQPMNSEIENILNEIYLAGRRVYAGVYDFRHDKTSDKLDVETRKNLLILLRQKKKLWKSCDIFVIEQQYFRTFKAKGKKGGGTEANVAAIKIGEAVFTWFLDHYPFRTVLYFGATYKTQICGAPNNLTKAQRKNWAIQKCREIHELREDKDIMEVFLLLDRIFRKRLTTEEKIQFYLDTFQGTSKDSKLLAKRIVRERQKADDWSDACVQLQAFIYKYLVARF